jgi:large subunit ribosomal protein L6
MSRIGKLPISVPSGVDVAIEGQKVTVTGPKGTLAHTVANPIEVIRSDGQIEVKRPDDERKSKELHGLTRTLVSNMILGVTQGFERKLEIHGVGYRVLARGPRQVEFKLRHSHPIVVDAPDGVSFTVQSATRFSVSGIDKQVVGEVAANIRKLQKPEPYKGKGIRYEGEHVRRKLGKAGK